jgi:hypothetical protein
VRPRRRGRPLRRRALGGGQVGGGHVGSDRIRPGLGVALQQSDWGVAPPALPPGRRRAGRLPAALAGVIAADPVGPRRAQQYDQNGRRGPTLKSAPPAQHERPTGPAEHGPTRAKTRGPE